MNHGNAIKYREVIRFRSGANAFMMVHAMDTLCGYVTYHGTHLFGEKISVSGVQCRTATKEEMRIWEDFKGDRISYARQMNALEDLEWAS